jgi:hypothetical protein
VEWITKKYNVLSLPAYAMALMWQAGTKYTMRKRVARKGGSFYFAVQYFFIFEALKKISVS